MAIPVPSLDLINDTRNNIRKSRLLSIMSFVFLSLLGIVIVYYLFITYSSSLFNYNTLKEGLIGQPRYLNPLFAHDNEIDRTITSLVFSSLVEYDFSSKTFVGELAEKYEIEDEGKVYHFWLKDNIYFHDGTKLTIDDILFTYEVVQHDNYHGFWKEAFADVKIEKINDLELKMTLEEPVASFIEHNTIGIIPKHLFDDVNDAMRPDHIFNVAPVGSGDFSYMKKELFSEELQKVESLFLESVDNSKPITKVQFYFFDSEDDLINAYKMGTINAFGTLNRNMKNTLSDWNNYNLIEKPLMSRYYGLFFNLSSDKRINSSETRKAIAQAINKDELMTTIFGDEEIQRITGPLENTSWAFDPNIETHIYSEDDAKVLLADIPEEELSFTLTYPDIGTNAQLAEQIKIYCEKVGITITLRSIAVHDLRDQVIGPRNFEILLLGQEVSHDPDRYTFWHSTQVNYPKLNISQYKNRFNDKALEDARETTNQEERKILYYDFQRYFQSDVPAIMLYQPNYYYFVANRFSDKMSIEELCIPEDRFNSII